MGAQCLVLVLLFSTLCPSTFTIILMKNVGCFTLIVLLMSCDCSCSVALLHGAVAWPSECNCGISQSYSLAFLQFQRLKIHFQDGYHFCHI